MKDKVLFFILGAVLATVTYFIGDLETTAEDEYHEIDKLRVKSLVVKNGIWVGDIGKKFIAIQTDNEYAHISLYGAEMPENPDDLTLGDTPVVSLVATAAAAVVRANSHSKRPEATCILGVTNTDGKYQSQLTLQDFDGMKSVSAD